MCVSSFASYIVVAAFKNQNTSVPPELTMHVSGKRKKLDVESFWICPGADPATVNMVIKRFQMGLSTLEDSGIGHW
jgi:hypothetical protein